MSKLSEAVVVLLLALPAVAQAQAFETISIKPAGASDPRSLTMRILANGDLEASTVPAQLLLSYAYDLPFNPTLRLAGAPGPTGRYDIMAKAPANAVPAGLSADEQRIRAQKMIRGLLADRFKLVMRVDQKTMPAYVLTVASGGPKFAKSTIAERDCLFDMRSPDSCHGFIAGRGHPVTARAVTMDDLVRYIESWTDLPVVNRTALSGLFAVEGEGWKPMRLPPRPPEFPQAPNFDDLPSIFTVLGKLGLELKRQEVTVPVYTVEKFEPPASE
jgi:uncharacterized protein (TIGR03435 family)